MTNFLFFPFRSSEIFPSIFSLKYPSDLASSSFDKPLGSFIDIKNYPVRKPRFLKRGRVVFLIGLGFGKAFKFPFNQALESELTPERTLQKENSNCGHF